jgi:transcriptional regulator with XRE-family HTH domain
MLNDTIIKTVDKDERTHQEIASLAKIDPGQLSRFLKGKSSLSLASTERLCDVLNLKLQ